MDEYIETINTVANLVNEESKIGTATFLETVIIHLLCLNSRLPDVFDHSDYPDTPDFDYKSIRTNVIQKFPFLSLYNIPNNLSTNIAQTEIIVGDAVDDLTDIIGDMKEIIWLIHNTSLENGIWMFKWGYMTHWGHHAINLLYYLRNMD